MTTNRPTLTLNFATIKNEITEQIAKANLQITQKLTQEKIPTIPKESSTNTLPNQPKRKLLMPHAKYRSILDYLQNTYPACFTTTPSPLALNIHQKLYQLEQQKPESTLSKTAIRQFLIIYTKSKIYQKSLRLGANRLELDGSISSIVNEEQIALAKTKKAAKKRLLGNKTETTNNIINPKTLSYDDQKN